MKNITGFGGGINIMDCSASDLRKLPCRDWQEELAGICSIIIVPELKRNGMHDSGYRCMDFAAVAADGIQDGNGILFNGYIQNTPGCPRILRILFTSFLPMLKRWANISTVTPSSSMAAITFRSRFSRW